MALYTSPSPLLLFLSQFWNAYLLYPFFFFTTLDSLNLLFLLLTSHFLPAGWSWCIHVVITPADMWRGSMHQTRRLLNCDQLFACCLTSFLTWRRKKNKKTCINTDVDALMYTCTYARLRLGVMSICLCVYSQLPQCKYLIKCCKAQTTTNRWHSVL